MKFQRRLVSVAKGKSVGLFSYMPESGPTPTMTAVGVLCRQHGGFHSDSPELVEGLTYVAANRSGTKNNSYFLYYATLAMHNVPGADWDAWNRETQKMLVDSQIQESCAAGSWNSEGRGHHAGPVMVTSLHALTLEVYYRYAPLYAKKKT